MSLTYCFSVPSGNSSPGYPRVERTVIILRGKKKSMKSPYFAIRILQQPNVLKSKRSLPKWDHKWSEDLRLSWWAYRKRKKQLQPMQLPLSICFKPRAKMLATGEALVIFTTFKVISDIFACLFIHSSTSIFWALCTSVRSNGQQNTLNSTLVELWPILV